MSNQFHGRIDSFVIANGDVSGGSVHRVASLGSAESEVLFDYGSFVLQTTTGVSGTFNCVVRGLIGTTASVPIPIAGLSSITTVGTFFVPMFNTSGATASNFIGVPKPYDVVWNAPTAVTGITATLHCILSKT